MGTWRAPGCRSHSQNLETFCSPKPGKNQGPAGGAAGTRLGQDLLHGSYGDIPGQGDSPCHPQTTQHQMKPTARALHASKSLLIKPFLFEVHLNLPFIKLPFSLINHSLSRSFKCKHRKGPSNCTSPFILLLLELGKATKQECQPTCLLLFNHFPMG